MSTLVKWVQNTQGKIINKKESQNGERKWIHPPEALQKGHIAYLVKFLGNTVVDQPKGKWYNTSITAPSATNGIFFK